MNNKNKVEFVVLWHRISRIFVWIPALLLVTLLLIFAAFQVPKLQTNFINQITDYIAQKTSFNISIGHANLTWYDKMLLEDIRLYEKETDSTLLSVDNLSIDISILNYLINQEISADELVLEKPYFHAIKTNDSTEVNINLFFSELKRVFKKDSTSKKTSIDIASILIKKGAFSYNDLRKDSIKAGKDYNHFKYQDIDGQLSNFIFALDSIGLLVDNLKSKDAQEKLHISSMKSQLTFTPRKLAFTELQLLIGKSFITDSIVLTYDKPGDFKYFIDKINFELHFNQSIISTEDLALFNIPTPPLHEQIILSGQITGSIKEIFAEDIELNFGENSTIAGGGYFIGLPNIKETFIYFDFQEMQLSPDDFKNYTNPEIQQYIDKIGLVHFEGEFSGFANDFVTNGSFTTPIGQLTSDINMKIRNKKMWYDGNIVMQDLELHKVFEDLTALKKVTLEGNIKGSGIKPNTANFDLKARIDSLQFNKYTFSGISTSGHFEKAFLDAKIDITDPNLIFDGEVEIDIRNNQNKFKINARLDTLNLQQIGLFDQNIHMSSDINLDVNAEIIEETTGYFSLGNSSIYYGENKLQIDSLHLFSTLIGKERITRLETDELVGEITGTYTNSELVKGIMELYKEVMLNLKNDYVEIENYYSSKQKNTLEKFTATLDLNLWDINKFIQPFYPELSIAKNTVVQAKLVFDTTSNFSFYSKLDSLSINGKELFNNELDIDFSKKYYSKDILSSVYYSSSHQKWRDNIETKDLITEFIWQKDKINCWSNINQEDFGNSIQLNASADFNKDVTSIQILPSSFTLLGNKWTWNDANNISITKDSISFSHFELTNKNQMLQVTGNYAEDTNESLNLNIMGIDLKQMKPITSYALEGIADGTLKIRKPSEQYLIDGDITIRAVKIEEVPIGNLFAVSSWDNITNALTIGIDQVRNGEKQVDIDGKLYLDGRSKPLDFIANFENADLRMGQPLVKKIFSNVQGGLTGQLAIKGSFDEPIIHGVGSITDGKSRVNYLKTTYTISGDVNFEENQVTTDNLELIDVENNIAKLTGGVQHNNFKNFNFNLDGRFDNFKLLNTNSLDNELYYGIAYGTGTVQFRGTLENIQIISEAKTVKGTRLSFPIGQSNNFTTEQKEYIQFGNLTNQNKGQNEEISSNGNHSRKIKGILLDLDLEMTTDAYLEMIFDIKAGDIIRGRGDGNINLLINTDGDFNMFGDYSINQGGYNFTLYNIINKEFDIRKGSSISWYGDPYGAQLNINARYRQLASLAPLLVFNNNEDVNSLELRKKYPSIVDLNLSGDLLTPNIKFDVNIEDYPKNIAISPNLTIDLDAQINAFKTEIRNNEQEMNRQVFSLIVLRKFSPENSFQVNTETLGNSISEFVSNQLSYWATQVDENLEIDVDLASLDDDAFNTFQLRLSYTFLGGRLRVSRGGGLPTDQNRDDISTIIGDWTVEYLLTEDGRFRAKMYSRNDLNTLDRQIGDNAIETGFSLQFIRSFDELKNIIRDKREKSILPSTTSAINN